MSQAAMLTGTVDTTTVRTTVDNFLLRNSIVVQPYIVLMEENFLLVQIWTYFLYFPSFSEPIRWQTRNVSTVVLSLECSSLWMFH